MCHHFEAYWMLEDAEETPSYLNTEADTEVELLTDGGGSDDS